MVIARVCGSSVSSGFSWLGDQASWWLLSLSPAESSGVHEPPPNQKLPEYGGVAQPKEENIPMLDMAPQDGHFYRGDSQYTVLELNCGSSGQGGIFILEIDPCLCTGRGC